jgi:hypothetical protein
VVRPHSALGYLTRPTTPTPGATTNQRGLSDPVYQRPGSGHSDSQLPKPVRTGVVTCEGMERAQAEAALVLSVVVRWGSVMTAVNGTLVARPARMIGVQPVGRGARSSLG